MLVLLLFLLGSGSLCLLLSGLWMVLWGLAQLVASVFRRTPEL